MRNPRNRSWKRFIDTLDFVTEGRRLHDENVGAYAAMSEQQKYLYGGDCKRRAITMKLISLISSDDLDDMIDEGGVNEYN